LRLSNSHKGDFRSMLEGQDPLGILSPKQSSDCATRLLRQAWAKGVGKRGLYAAALANGKECFCFLKTQLDSFRVYYTDDSGKSRYRKVISVRRFPSGAERYWHFAIEGRPLLRPLIGYSIISHVVFSDDGLQIWNDPDRMHRARRRQCRTWWNPTWRDRILAMMGWLADEDGLVRLPVSADSLISIASHPHHFVSPVSYTTQEVADGEDDEVLDVDDNAGQL
jgi:hypothetical protein